MQRFKTATVFFAALLAAGATLGAHAEVRLGLMAPLTGPLGITGQEVKRGFDLALEQLGGRVGGQDTVVFTANDQANPTTAVSEFSRLVERERIAVLVGIAASNVALALAQPSEKANITVVLTQAGPNELAGKGCQENIFSLGHQNEQYATAMASYLKQKGFKKIYFMGMDFQAGWDILDAFQNGMGGPVAGKALTSLGQVDFAPEMARLRDLKPDAVFSFYSGGAAVAFVRQYAGAGLKDQFPLFGIGAMTDSLTIKAQGEAAVGVTTSNTWNASLRNPENERFVAAYKARNEGREPTTFAAQTYDSVMYLDAALRKTKGSTEPRALRAALRDDVGFKSIRGALKLNRNQFPIQDMLIERVVKNDRGELTHQIIETVPKVADRFASECTAK